MTIKDFDPAQTGLANGTTLTTANSGGGTNTPFNTVSASGIVVAQLNSDTVIQTVNPTTSEQIGWFALATSVKAIYLLNIPTLPPNAEIIFHRAAYGTASGTEVGAAFTVSFKVSGVFGSTVVNPATGAAFLSTGFSPSSGEWRIEILYTLTTFRLLAYQGRSSTTVAYDSGVITPTTAIVSGGNSYVTMRGFKYDSSSLTQTYSLLRVGYRDGSDVTSAAEPYSVGAALALVGAVTPAPYTAGQQLTLTLTATGGNANAKTYSCTWDGTSMGPQSSNVFTHTDSASTPAGTTKSITASVSQAP